MKLSSLKINAAAIESGRWIDIPDLQGVALRVRGLGNSDYRKLSIKLRDAIPRAERIKGLAPEKTEEMTTTLLVETVLVDWRGLEGDDGKALAFERGAAAELLANPDFGRLREAVLWASTVVGDDEIAALEADAKN